MSKGSRASLYTYTFAHFCVDFACFFMLFRGFAAGVGVGAGASGIETLALGFLLYNIIAFGLQPFIGYFSDVYKHRKKSLPIALYGCAILILGLALISFHWVSLVVCAIGNACFHVGGGIDSLVNSGGKLARSGVFVSSGALGVALGTMAGKGSSVSLIVPTLLLLASWVLLNFYVRGDRKGKGVPGGDSIEEGRFGKGACAGDAGDAFAWLQPAGIAGSLVLVLCLISVFIRSYIGSTIPAAWRTTAFLLLLPGIGAFLGKAAGGYLADLFGARNVSALTLLSSIPFLCFGFNNPVYYTIGIILFNMTMPIMLCAVAAQLPGGPGLAFGLTTLLLLCGNMPTYFLALPASWLVPVAAGLIAISAVCMHISLTNSKGAVNNAKAYESV